MARAFLIIEAMVEEEAREERRNQALTTIRLHRDLRTRARPLQMSEGLFKKHYRLSKTLFLNLSSELAPFFASRRRKTKIELQTKILTALSFYATGSYQKPVGMSYIHALSQSSVSNAIKEVTMALNQPSVLRKYIHFPQTEAERRAIINGFSRKFGFPGVLGCVDGTHVALVRPSVNEERFYNRKHYHSRNVQIICDSDLNILNIDATFGGSTHDAYIWRRSPVHDHLQALHQAGENLWFLGDSGYPLRPWLLTPILNAAPGTAEENYTNIHTRTRNTVERCIGVLKARWRCLLAHRVLHYDDGTVAQIINACAVLHNIANTARLAVPELPEADRIRETQLQVSPQAPSGSLAIAGETDLMRGRRTRDMIVRRLNN